MKLTTDPSKTKTPIPSAIIGGANSLSPVVRRHHTAGHVDLFNSLNYVLQDCHALDEDGCWDPWAGSPKTKEPKTSIRMAMLGMHAPLMRTVAETFGVAARSAAHAREINWEFDGQLYICGALSGVLGHDDESQSSSESSSESGAGDHHNDDDISPSCFPAKTSNKQTKTLQQTGGPKNPKPAINFARPLHIRP